MNISLSTQRHELKLENIPNEIIPLNQWHFRTNDLHQTPILNDIIDYQHKVTLQEVITNRDRQIQRRTEMVVHRHLICQHDLSAK